MAVQGTFASTGSVEQYLDIGDVVEYQFPSVPDPNLSDVVITLRGVLTCEVEPLVMIIPSFNWDQFAISESGSHIIGITNPGYIWISTNSGTTWNAVSGNPGIDYWSCCSISSDGTKIVAGSQVNLGGSGNIWFSTDSGATWNQAELSAENWVGVIFQGTNIVAITLEGYVFTSTDSGSTWIHQSNISSVGQLFNLVSDYTGEILLTASVGSPYKLARSIDNGVNWSEVSPGSLNEAVPLACSSDGAIIYAAEGSSSGIWNSTDSGSTWTSITATTIGDVNYTPISTSSLACSMDGSKIITGDIFEGLYLSSDSGSTWLLESALPNGSTSYLAAIAISGSGDVLIAGDTSTGFIWLSVDGGFVWNSIVLVEP